MHGSATTMSVDRAHREEVPCADFGPQKDVPRLAHGPERILSAECDANDVPYPEGQIDPRM